MDIVKKGWHPKGKDGKGESWRGDNKGINQVAGWIGKGKDKNAIRSREHEATPLESLRDPTTFEPPPKRIDQQDFTATPTAKSPSESRVGAPLVRKRTVYTEEKKSGEEEEEDEVVPTRPPVPYRANTTGLNTDSLPKPPVRRKMSGTEEDVAQLPARPKPRLPPRLPPRRESISPPPSYIIATRESPAKVGDLNQMSLNRLGAAGVSVSALNIGVQNPPSVQRRDSTSSHRSPEPMQTSKLTPQLREIQSKFSNSPTTVPSPTAKEGTTFAQKKAALRTAKNLRNDPSSVSLGDAKTAASTANNFRERHEGQITQGMKTVDGLNQQHDLINRANSLVGNAPQEKPIPDITIKKKPPPPPPKKKDLHRLSGTEVPASPPPIPISSKPKLPVSADNHNVA